MVSVVVVIVVWGPGMVPVDGRDGALVPGWCLCVSNRGSRRAVDASDSVEIKV